MEPKDKPRYMVTPWVVAEVQRLLQLDREFRVAALAARNNQQRRGRRLQSGRNLKAAK